jgi:hypothetical protein
MDLKVKEKVRKLHSELMSIADKEGMSLEDLLESCVEGEGEEDGEEDMEEEKPEMEKPAVDKAKIAFIIGKMRGGPRGE